MHTLHKKVIAAMGAMAFLSPGLAMASATAENTCAASADDAAIWLTRHALQDPTAAVAILEAKSKASLSARLKQLLDDRYAPASAELRERLWGVEWTAAKLQAATEQELLVRFFTYRQQQRDSFQISNVTVTNRVSSNVLGTTDVTVSYQVQADTSARTMQRTYTAHTDGQCWRLLVPVETWARLEVIARELKASRPPNTGNRVGAPQARLAVVPSSDQPVAGWQTVARPGRVAGDIIWVRNEALATEAHVLSASANWDCQSGGDLETPAVAITLNKDGAKRLQSWSANHVGRTLAVTLDGTPVFHAKVVEPLNDKIMACLDQATLEEARAIAARLNGASPR